MGQNASKKNNTVPSKPARTEPRLPGYWNTKSLIPTQLPYNPRPTTTTLTTSAATSSNTVPYIQRPLSSYETWTQHYSRFLNKQNDENLYGTNNRHQDDGYRKILELDELRFSMQLKRQAAVNEKYIQANSTPTPITINSFLPLGSRLQSRRENDAKYFTIKKRRPELTDDMVKHIQSMKASPLNCLLTEIDGVQILGKDIRTLIGLNWLNDEIINAFMTLLVYRAKKPGYRKVHSFNTFFYPKLRESGYNSVRRWTRKVDIFDFDYIVVPVHLGNHWTLVFIDFKQRTISYYDSLGGYLDGYCDTLLDYLRSEMRDKKKQEFSDSGWRLLNRSQDGIPQQNNCSDCGVFTCIYAEHLTRESELDFSQQDMPYYRDRMIFEITKQRILD